MWKSMRNGAIAAALGGAALALGGCAYNEALGRDQFLLVNDASLGSAAQQAWAQTLATHRISRDPAATARVVRVAERIIDAADLGDRRWDIVVFDDPSANAFVLPGNRMGVNTGLLRVAANDDQLAAVIGHEVGHAIANHAAERYSQSAATSLVLSGAQRYLGGSDGSGRQIAALGGVGAQLGILLPFSRKHELEADRIGVDIMARAGYRPAEALTLWENMAQARTRGAPPQFLSTHPSDSIRLAALEQHLASRGYLMSSR